MFHDLCSEIYASGAEWASEAVQTLRRAQFQLLQGIEPVSPALHPAALSLHGLLTELSRHQSYSGAKFRPCQKTGGYAPPELWHGGTGSISGQILWDLWWTKWLLGQISSKYFDFPCQFTFHKLLRLLLVSDHSAL
jgi:hypothetical protein